APLGLEPPTPSVAPDPPEPPPPLPPPGCVGPPAPRSGAVRASRSRSIGLVRLVRLSEVIMRGLDFILRQRAARAKCILRHRQSPYPAHRRVLEIGRAHV